MMRNPLDRLEAAPWTRTLMRTGLLGVAVTLLWGSGLLSSSGFESAGAQSSDRFPVIGTVSGDDVYIRAGGSRNYRAITKLSLGSEIIVNGLEGDWLSFHLPPYASCWMHADFVEPTATAGEFAVSGSSVLLRPTAGKQYTALGKVTKGRIVRVRERSKDGQWVRIDGIPEAKAWIHVDFVKPVKGIGVEEIASVFPRLKPGRKAVMPAPAGGSTGGNVAAGTSPEGASGTKPTAGTDDSSNPKAAAPRPAQPDLPAIVSKRLHGIYDRWKAEIEKPAITWSFTSILADLGSIVENSEDTGEVALASAWVRFIQDVHLPIVRGLVEDERKRQAARVRREAGERQEKRAPEAITNRPKVGGKYLAKGWVFAMGKNSKVKGTHKLMKGNKLLFYLNSDSLDLDAYVYKRIGVQGILEDLPKEAGARLIRVTSIDVLSP